MSADTTQYLSTTEFANRYNASMTIDKDHMPLEPSFVKLLCEQGQIEHSIIPARDGRKRDTLMIPEYELDKLDILLNKDKAEEPKVVADDGTKQTFLNTKEVAELIGYDVSHVNSLVREGKLKVAKTFSSGKGGRQGRLFDEDYILEYMESHPKRKYTKKEKPVTNASKVSELEKLNADLEVKIMHLEHKISDLEIENKWLETANADLKKVIASQKEQISNSRGYSEEEFFEAYRKGFKDGYEMGGKQ